MSKPRIRFIGEGWERYARDVMPADAQKVQRIETRRAFYAGAIQALGVVLRIAALPEAEGVALLQDMHLEVTEFSERADKGEA